MRNHAGFDARVVRHVYFAEVDAPSGFLRMNTSARNITLEGNVYEGVGGLGSISDYSATVGTSPTALRLTLNRIPSALVIQLMNESMRNRRVRVFLALLAPSELIATEPFLWFVGRVDTFNLNVGKVTSATLTATSRLINWAKATNSRYTHEDQQKKYPNDQGLKFISSLATTKLTWGQ